MTIIFGTKVTLNCNDCDKELHLESPFEIQKHDMSISERFLDSIREAYVDHNKRDECHPKEPE